MTLTYLKGVKLGIIYGIYRKSIDKIGKYRRNCLHKVGYYGIIQTRERGNIDDIYELLKRV